MEDRDIIKALECCANHSANANYRLTYQGQPLKLLLDNALDLIKRQMDKNKAYRHYYDECLKDLKKANTEIERLEETKNRLSYNLQAVLDERADHSEAVKEFAEELKERYSMEIDGYYGEVVFTCDIDNLVKEMVGEG